MERHVIVSYFKLSLKVFGRAAEVSPLFKWPSLSHSKQVRPISELFSTCGSIAVYREWGNAADTGKRSDSGTAVLEPLSTCKFSGPHYRKRTFGKLHLIVYFAQPGYICALVNRAGA